MLKVVGASWVQTRVTLFTLAAVTLFGILTYYYGGVSPPSHDGNYAATVFWSRTAGYRIQFWGQNNDPSYVKKGVARAYYRPDMSRDGWASMEIESQEQYPDAVQAHAAGLLEGSLSWQLIYYHWKNTIEKACENREQFCDQARIILDQNTVNIREKARMFDHVDPFWHQVNLFYEQLDGLEVGWRYAVDRSRKDFDIPHQDFLWMNMACDLQDLELMYNTTLDALVYPHQPPLSMALLKLLPDQPGQFLLAHASSSFYSAMLRVQKRYHLRLHMTGDSRTALVPGQAITFTSYPGTVHSQDDFYQIGGSRLTVTGTAIKNLNQSRWAKAQVTAEAFMGPRVMAANRIATNGSQWAKMVSRSYSGTGNKQWLVVQPVGESVQLWVTEQVPGLTHAEPQSSALQTTGYWASYGLPFYKDVLNVSGNSKSAFQASNPVAKVLAAGQSNVTDLDSLICLMRSPDLTLVGRSDLSIEDIRQMEEDYQQRFLRSSTETNNEILHRDEEEKEQITPPHFVHNVKEVFNTIISMKRLTDELRNMEGHSARPNEKSQEYKVQEELPEINLIVDKRKVSGGEESTVFSLREFSGVIDLKVSKKDGYLAAAGPPFSVSHGAVVVQPFQWSKSPIKDLPHVGQADVWDFEPVKPNWVWD